MYHLRRAALKALSSSSSTTSFARAPRCVPSSATLSSSSPFSLLSTAQRSGVLLSTRRGYATDRDDDHEDNYKDDKPVLDKAKDAISGAFGSASEALGNVSSRISGLASSGQFGSSGASDAESGPSLYVGNLYFEVNEEILRKEFSKFGTVNNVKIISDARGMSKGFGYIEFADTESATAAMESLNGQVLEGRRLAVQYAVRKSGGPGGGRSSGNMSGNNFSGSSYGGGSTNAPSKTLFIGNMSYEMSDKDLNELFREVKNVLDVRVAIDRRTGQPRGFAHADFIDVESAEKAATYLRAKEFYGRPLRIDFSTGTAGSTKR